MRVRVSAIRHSPCVHRWRMSIPSHSTTAKKTESIQPGSYAWRRAFDGPLNGSIGALYWNGRRQERLDVDHRCRAPDRIVSGTASTTRSVRSTSTMAAPVTRIPRSAPYQADGETVPADRATRTIAIRNTGRYTATSTFEFIENWTVNRSKAATTTRTSRVDGPIFFEPGCQRRAGRPESLAGSSSVACQAFDDLPCRRASIYGRLIFSVDRRGRGRQ